MSTSTPNPPVRRGLLYRALLAVLAEESPLRRARHCIELAPDWRASWPDYEAATFRAKDDIPRRQNNLTWGTTDLVAAGWLTKSPQGWAITETGRAAPSRYADDDALAAVPTHAYRDYWIKT